MTLHVHIVCTGNICRSPVAAQLLSLAFPGEIDATSSGLAAVVGAGIEPHMRASMVVAGVAPLPHAARRTTEAELAGADLVLTMTTGQRGAVVELAPQVLRRTFTLVEFVRLAESLHASGRAGWDAGESAERRMRQLIPLAARFRGTPGLTSSDDIDDPFGQDDAAYATAFARIREAMSRLSALLGHEKLA